MTVNAPAGWTVQVRDAPYATFAKGLGTNAPSDIAYFTAGTCSTVTAQVASTTRSP